MEGYGAGLEALGCCYGDLGCEVVVFGLRVSMVYDEKEDNILGRSFYGLETFVWFLVSFYQYRILWSTCNVGIIGVGI